MKPRNCSDCAAYFEQSAGASGEVGVGQCRLHPPTVFMVMAQGLHGQPQPIPISFFPQIAGNAWCRDFVFGSAIKLEMNG